MPLNIRKSWHSI